MKTLVLGTMPHGATPQTHIPAGIWCFSGVEQHFPQWWEAHQFGPLLPQDPFPTPGGTTTACLAANAETARLLPLLGEAMNQQRGVTRSSVFWEMALGPWLLLCVHMLYERQTRLEGLIATHGETPLRVPLLPKYPVPVFTNSHNFMVHGVLDVACTHYLLSRMLEHMAPPAWQLEYPWGKEQPLGAVGILPPLGAASVNTALPVAQGVAAISRNNFPPSSRSPLAALKNMGKEASTALLLRLPFPRHKGFPLWMSLGLSTAVLANKNPRDNSTPFAQYGQEEGEGIHWQFPLFTMVQQLVPLSLVAYPLPQVPHSQGKLRGMGPAFSQDDAYRLPLAAWREGGGKLFCLQHGANYGNLASVGVIAFEYGQHAFFSWGFTAHPPYPVHAIPMPSPALCQRNNTYKQQSDALILVGSEMSTLAYRLKTRPYAHSLVSYREAKKEFIQALPQAARQHLTYRPYPTTPGGLEDGPYIQQEFPDVPLCKGDLTQQMLGCRLLVLDHYGTTLHTAFAANIPTLLFWNPDHWGMEPQSASILEALHSAGIYHHTAQEAAEAVERIWQNPAAWWHSAPVQAARTMWCSHYAQHTPPKGGLLGLFSQWNKALRQC
ncbi:LIC12162 family transferase [Desulfovibrio cuneatus]|uniref:LIC12162 family transferase n=1 Tax=Desulfovibrio cuneatus TaxID=159728 RepID=UPI000418EA8D|nr:LIC12162 family protein [Desulfovibrio cuneatus]